MPCTWDYPERLASPEFVDYLRLPINNAARHTWQASPPPQRKGDILTVNTTHVKRNYLRPIGVRRSDKASSRAFRWHGDYLTLLTYIDDPVYLAEPLLRTSGYMLDPSGNSNRFASRDRIRHRNAMPCEGAGPAAHSSREAARAIFEGTRAVHAIASSGIAKHRDRR